jgi:hypothetical protein
MISPVDSAGTETPRGGVSNSARNFSEIAGPIVPESDLPSSGY